MRLSLETDEISITISVPSTWLPDVADDMANRVLDVYARAVAINRAYDTDDQ